jgi:hypothetical protein
MICTPTGRPLSLRPIGALAGRPVVATPIHAHLLAVDIKLSRASVSKGAERPGRPFQLGLTF